MASSIAVLCHSTMPFPFSSVSQEEWESFRLHAEVQSGAQGWRRSTVHQISTELPCGVTESEAESEAT